MRKKIILMMVAMMVALSFITNGLAQPASEKAPQKITVTGKIEYDKKTGGYTVQAENPPAMLFIVNPDKKILDRLMKSGQPVRIEGQLTIGADHLKINKINGQKYP